jgi:hypothetical protein
MIDYMPAKAENSFLGQFSMVAENLQRMEIQDEASKPMFELALKRAAAAAVLGASPFYKKCYTLGKYTMQVHMRRSADIPNRFVCCLTSLQTSSTLMVFVLAMVLYPEVQKRAQAEIDSVIGRDRLPTFDDRASLPYVESILRETFRWHPILPLGNLPRCVILPLLKIIM